MQHDKHWYMLIFHFMGRGQHSVVKVNFYDVKYLSFVLSIKSAHFFLITISLGTTNNVIVPVGPIRLTNTNIARMIVYIQNDHQYAISLMHGTIKHLN